MLDPLPNVTVTSKSEYRQLTPDEIKSVEHIFTERGVSLPNPATSTFVGMVENEEVICFIVLQAVLHAEPIYIKEGRSECFVPLVHEAERTILQKCGPQFVYVFVPAGRVSQLATSMGMQLEPWNVMSKLIMPNVPSKIGIDLTSLPLGDAPSEEVVQ